LRRECSTQFQPTICIGYRQLLLAQRSASLRSEPDSTIPDTPIEIATGMAQLVLEMKNGRDARLRQRLELLAEHFLHVTGQSGESGSICADPECQSHTG
jgi:hypothetical protein